MTRMKMSLSARLCGLGMLLAFPGMDFVRAAGVIAPLVSSLASDPEAWKSTPLPAEWKDVGGAPGTRRKESTTQEPVFGLAVQRCIASSNAEGLARLDLLFVERGTAAADAAWQQSLRQTASRLSTTLQNGLGPGQVVRPPAGSPAGTVIQEWTTAAAQVRLSLEPGSRLWLTLTPQAASKTAKVTKTDLKTRVLERENGDVIITGLRSMPKTLDTGDTILRIAECLVSHYGWKMNAEATARSLGWRPQDGAFDEAKLFEAMSREAGVRVKSFTKLDLLEVRRAIDRGQPVVFTRAWTEVRHRYHQEFAQRLAADPNLRLPNAKNDAEKAQWPSLDTRGFRNRAMIVGYNKKRGEIIFSHPGWGPEDENLRLSEEEALFSTSIMYCLTPS